MGYREWCSKNERWHFYLMHFYSLKNNYCLFVAAVLQFMQLPKITGPWIPPPPILEILKATCFLWKCFDFSPGSRYTREKTSRNQPVGILLLRLTTAEVVGKRASSHIKFTNIWPSTRVGLQTFVYPHVCVTIFLNQIKKLLQRYKAFPPTH